MKLKVVFVGTVLLAFSFTQVMNAQQKKGEPWTIPAEYKKMANPVAKDDANLKLGASSWAKNCASCHGKTGLGDGPKGRMTKTFPGDFSAAAFQAFTDGEMFYQTKMGRGEMPAYDKKIPDNEIWAMVHHMRSFKK
ncbi:MAG: cytochrome c [Bacteroidales bacterium]|jgi:mono/diheme cytochrome c family protein|nr:cytochrome c [Bacteroidales bacterium]